MGLVKTPPSVIRPGNHKSETDRTRSDHMGDISCSLVSSEKGGNDLRRESMRQQRQICSGYVHWWVLLRGDHNE